MKTNHKLKDLRLASETDFRTTSGTLVLNLEYYEYMLGHRVWERQITDEFTDREWLKTKISFGFIKLPNILVYWNRKPSELLKESTDYTKLIQNTNNRKTVFMNT